MYYYLFGLPSRALLSALERIELAGLFKDYAIELLNLKKRADARGYVDGAVLMAGGIALKWFPPIGVPTFIFGVAVFARNQFVDSKWGPRTAAMKDLAQYIAGLLDA